MATSALSSLRLLLPPLEGEPVDLLLVAYIAIGVLVLRVVMERLMLPTLTRFFATRLKGTASEGKGGRTATNVFNNVFIATSSFAMTAWAWHATATANGGCTPFNTAPCLRDWPDLPVTLEFKLVWLTIFGFYAYEMLGTALGIGCVLRCARPDPDALCMQSVPSMLHMLASPNAAVPDAVLCA